jgi:hypothetical protein
LLSFSILVRLAILFSRILRLLLLLSFLLFALFLLSCISGDRLKGVFVVLLALLVLLLVSLAFCGSGWQILLLEVYLVILVVRHYC